jgi:hypothetical protein
LILHSTQAGWRSEKYFFNSLERFLQVCGITSQGPLGQMSTGDFIANDAVGWRAVMDCCLAELPGM